MTRKKYFFVKIDLFDVDVEVFVNFTEADLRSRFRKSERFSRVCQSFGGWDDNSEDGRACFPGGAPLLLLRLKSNPSHKVAALVAHEAMHVGSEILRERGIRHTEETEEIYARMLDYLVQEILRRLWERAKPQ